jgi:hypothetical protein
LEMAIQTTGYENRSTGWPLSIATGIDLPAGCPPLSRAGIGSVRRHCALRLPGGANARWRKTPTPPARSGSRHCRRIR